MAPITKESDARHQRLRSYKGATGVAAIARWSTRVVDMITRSRSKLPHLAQDAEAARSVFSAAVAALLQRADGL